MPIPGTWDDPKKKVTDDPGNITPITISAVSGGSPSGGSTTVTWTTNVAATSLVNYGVSPNMKQLSTAETDKSPTVTSHSVTLSNLVAGKTYLFQVVSRYVGNGYLFTAVGKFVGA